MTRKKLLFGLYMQFRRKLALILLFITIIILTYFMWFKPKPTVTYIPARISIYEEMFDVKKVPAGLIIWKHGVPGTETNFIFAEPPTRYEFFDIGVLTQRGVVYKVRVPFYALAMFTLGKTINMEQEPQSHDNQRVPIMPKQNKRNISEKI